LTDDECSLFRSPPSKDLITSGAGLVARKVTGPSAPPKPRLQPSNQPFRWAGAWRFAYEIAFTNMDFFVDQDASIFNLPEDAPWGIWVSLTLGGRISELVNG